MRQHEPSTTAPPPPQFLLGRSALAVGQDSLYNFRSSTEHTRTWSSIIPLESGSTRVRLLCSSSSFFSFQKPATPWRWFRMLRALRPTRGKSIACQGRIRPSPARRDVNRQNTGRSLSGTPARLSPSQTHPIEHGNNTKASRFSRLVGLVEETATDGQTVVAEPYDHQTEIIREAFRNTPLFSSAAHDFVESAVKSSAIGDQARTSYLNTG